MRLGTRGSALALWQAEHVADRLRAAGHRVEIVEYSTKGDRILDTPLAEIGDKGLFTQELDQALLAGDLHLAVHSLKDLPTVLPEGLALAAVASRAEPFDAFVAHRDFLGKLADVPPGAIIATSSLRRQAQLLAWRPDLRIVPVRGNVPTRLAKLDESGVPGAGGWHGVVLAAAGLTRLGMENRITERIEADVMLPAVSQGALGIVTASGDADATEAVRRALADPEETITTAAERALLRRLEGGCQVPVAALATLDGERLQIEAAVIALDGSSVVRETFAGDSMRPEELGEALAERLLSLGADRILADIRSNPS
jgi:hydroxymethylbilane synthase